MNRIILKRLKGFWILLLVLFFLIVLGQGRSVENLVKNNGQKPKYYRFPLKLESPGGRYLVDQDNKPFFWSGDAAWSLIAQLSKEDAEFYLNGRKEKGFTVVLVSLIEHKFCSNAPANFYGDIPFTGKVFVTANEKYFEHADFVIRSAAERDIIVLLAPLYLGYGCKDEGWCAETKAAPGEDLRSWGRYIGRRYKDFSNIVWLIGGDTDPSPVKDKVLEMVKGIREYDTIHFFSGHNQPGTMAITPWPGESWLSVNNVYSYDSTLYWFYKKAYDEKPVMPYYQIESAYENEHQSTPQQLRSQAYWAILSGAMGHIFGNCPVWHFGSFPTWCSLTDWKTEMNNSGSVSMDYLQRLFRSRSWHTLIPDYEHQIITSGYGTWGLKDYVTTACTSDKNTIIAYLPSRRMVSADMSKIAGEKAKCWWYDPSNGIAELVGTYKTSDIRNFVPRAEGDWVLVIDNASVRLAAPGKQQ